MSRFLQLAMMWGQLVRPLRCASLCRVSCRLFSETTTAASEPSSSEVDLVKPASTEVSRPPGRRTGTRKWHFGKLTKDREVRFNPWMVGRHDVPHEPDLLREFDGRPFHELPIVNLKAKKNNTVMCVTDCDGTVIPGCLSSCGTEGFINARKQSSVAAQAVGISIGLKAKRAGIDTVRLVIKGLGSGRIPGIQGLKMSGLNIVSITENSPIHYGLGRRPRVPPRK